MGNTVLGYGLGLASNSAVKPMFAKRTVTMMGDGGFWHNGLTTGIANTVFNKNDGILVIMKNGYSSATGTQELPSSPQHSDTHAPDMSMERALAGIGVDWVQHRRQLPRRRRGEDAEGSDDHRPQGPQGHHRRGRVPARAATQARPVVAKN
jgi:indolepyruvate ferredoxin oxidoreductase alpha subunit